MLLDCFAAALVTALQTEPAVALAVISSRYVRKFFVQVGLASLIRLKPTLWSRLTPIQLVC